jgi:hypothetical protein
MVFGDIAVYPLTVHYMEKLPYQLFHPVIDREERRRREQMGVLHTADMIRYHTQHKILPPNKILGKGESPYFWGQTR